MRVNNLVLRCYAEQDGNQWNALCVDLNIAAQADTYEEVRQKLDQMVYTYVFDALVGVDREHAVDLLTRKAPLKHRLKYHAYSWAKKLDAKLHGKSVAPAKAIRAGHLAFKEALPMPLAACH